jgi:hypothetical protein
MANARDVFARLQLQAPRRCRDLADQPPGPVNKNLDPAAVLGRILDVLEQNWRVLRMTGYALRVV